MGRRKECFMRPWNFVDFLTKPTDGSAGDKMNEWEGDGGWVFAVLGQATGFLVSHFWDNIDQRRECGWGGGGWMIELMG
jgi:hypothetical protein